ncbi:MAG TPA: hypothetical protein VE988_13030 [Gemmataceae bacterium]|nr:hypothetical protein [Gemmataceae bacterium]
MSAADSHFLVDSYEIDVKIWTIPRQALEVQHGRVNRVVETDNRAKITRRVVFSESNTSLRPFTLRYATQNLGFLFPPVLNADNVAPAAELNRYDAYGTEYRFDFIPRPGRAFSMEFEVLNGFDSGHHMVSFRAHPDTTYDRIVCTLDLSECGYKQGVGAVQPMAFLHRFDYKHGELWKYRAMAELVTPAKARLGASRWQWQLSQINRGILDVVWECDPFSNPAPGASQFGLQASRDGKGQESVVQGIAAMGIEVYRLRNQLKVFHEIGNILNQLGKDTCHSFSDLAVLLFEKARKEKDDFDRGASSLRNYFRELATFFSTYFAEFHADEYKRFVAKGIPFMKRVGGAKPRFTEFSWRAWEETGRYFADLKNAAATAK